VIQRRLWIEKRLNVCCSSGYAKLGYKYAIIAKELIDVYIVDLVHLAAGNILLKYKI
jgi:hypothetical protein